MTNKPTGSKATARKFKQRYTTKAQAVAAAEHQRKIHSTYWKAVIEFIKGEKDDSN